MNFTVAIDGPAAAGKGTISREVAKAFGFAHLDTGTLYRAVGLKALAHGQGIIDPIAAEELAKRLSFDDLGGDELRMPRAARAASKVAVLAGVRSALVAFQRDFARRPGGAVLDGRDIGTVICPEADVKIYVTASDSVRAGRRYLELREKGVETTLDQVLADLRARDARDANRDVAPLIKAPDAHLLDTTDLSIDAAVAEAVALIKKRINEGRA